MDELDLMRTFLAVYRTRSLPKAALELELAQPVAGQRLKTLEGVIGKPLFDMQGRGLVPTQAAHDLARAAAPYLDGLEAVVAAAKARSGAITGIVRIGGPAEILATRIVPHLAVLNDIGVRLHLRFAPREDLMADLSVGELDLAVFSGRAQEEGVGTWTLFTERLVAVASPRWFARIAGDPPGPERLERIPLLSAGEGDSDVGRYFLEVFGRPCTVEPAIVLPDQRGLATAAAAGAGLAVLPRHLVGRELAEGLLVEIHEAPEPPGDDIVLAWSQIALRHPRTVFVRDAIVNAAKGWGG